MALRLQYYLRFAHQTRSFTTTPPRLKEPKTNVLTLLPKSPNAASIPPYPYPKAQWFKQADSGLYGGAKIQFGNNVSHAKHPKHDTKSRRTWMPNVHFKRIFSRALGRKLRLKVTPAVQRSIEKAGGLDEYVTGLKPRRLKELGPEGWNLRWVILASGGMKKRTKGNEALRRMVEKLEKLQNDPTLGKTRISMVMEDARKEEPLDVNFAEVQERISAQLKRRGTHLDEAPAPSMGFGQRLWTTTKALFSPSTYFPKRS